jgi:PAS domain S-box-containing protein
LQTFFDHVAVGIAVSDLEGRLVDVNPALCSMFGAERDEFLGHAMTRHLLRSQDEAPGDGLLDELIGGARQHYNVENCYRRADGGSLWARVSVSLIRPGGGAPPRVVHVIQDISEAKRDDAEHRAREGLVRLGEMAAAIAHEVRSPLAAILGAVELLAMRLPEEQGAGQVLGEIRRRIGSVDALVNQLLLFARPKELGFARLSVVALLRETAALLRTRGVLGDVGVDIASEGDGDAEVLGGAVLLGSVFGDRANNAAQARTGRGVL